MTLYNSPLISVIIPIYNLERYISICLDSVISQTYSNLEIILVNDGSTDRTLEICNIYANKDNRIKILNKDNDGVSSARNAALDILLGKYFIFVDGDDYIGSEHIYNLYRNIIINNSDVCIGYYTEIVNNNPLVMDHKVEYTEISSNESILNMVYHKVYGGEPVSKLFCSDLIRANNIRFDISQKVGEDFNFCCITLSKAKKICLCNEHSYFYIRRSVSVTRGSIKISMNRLKSYRKYKDFINHNYAEDSNLKHSMSFYYLFCIVEIINRIIDSNAINKRRLLRILTFRIRKSLFNVIKNKNTDNKFKIKLILISLHVNIYKTFRKKYLEHSNKI